MPTGPSPSFFENLSGPTLAARRTAIPPKPNHRLNLWSIVKNCVGKDLTKIPMPVSGGWLATRRTLIFILGGGPHLMGFKLDHTLGGSFIVFYGTVIPD